MSRFTQVGRNSQLPRRRSMHALKKGICVPTTLLICENSHGDVWGIRNVLPIHEVPVYLLWPWKKLTSLPT